MFVLLPQLFDFDIEVKPILEVLVGKTVEQALLEVMEEEELSNLRAQQRRFKELRNAELVETQRLEEQERRHREEKERRMKQQAEVLRKEKETGEKISARAFAQVIATFERYKIISDSLGTCKMGNNNPQNSQSHLTIHCFILMCRVILRTLCLQCLVH